MTKLQVNPGICGLKTQLTITADDMQLVAIEMHSVSTHHGNSR